MARELRVKVTGDSSGAIVALQETQSAIKKLGSESVTSVGQSKAEFSSLLAEIEKTSPELAGLSKAAFDAGLALDKAGDSKSIGQLTQRLIEAQIKVDQFAAGLEKAAASGADVGDKPTKSLQNMQAAIDTLKAHLGNLEGATEEAKAKLGFVGEPGAKSLGTLAKETKAATDAIKGLEEAGSLREMQLSFNQAHFAAVSLREAIEQVERAGGKVDDEAVAALKDLEHAAESAAAKSLGTLAKETKAATDAIKGLEEAGSLHEMHRSFNQAHFAAVSLREAIEQVERAGGKVDDEAVAALKDLEHAAESAAGMLAKVKDAEVDAAEKAKIQGDAYSTLRGEVGDLSGMFDKMRETGSGATKAIGTVGTAIGVASVAITGAIQAGKQLAEGIDALSEKYAKLQQKQIDQKIRLQEQDIATRAADRGLIEHGKTIADTVENYNRFAVAQGKLSEGGRRFIETVAGLKVPPTFEDLSKRVDAIGIAFEGAYKRSKEYGDRFLLDNAAELKELAQRYSDLGQQVPETLQKLIDKLEAMAAAGKSTAAGVGQAAEKVMTLAEAAAQAGPSLDGMRERIMDAAKASDVAAAINAKYRDQLKDTTTVVNEFGRNAFDQSRWDENTRDINASVAASKAWDQALRDGMDAWAVAGQAMGKFSVDVRHATKDYVDTGDAALDLIERLARANDTLGDLSIFAGSWIAELEKGNITIGEFRKKLDELVVGLPYYSAVLQAAGVDTKDTQQALSGMYRALGDIGLQWSEWFKKRDAAIAKSREEWRKLQDEIKKTGDAATVAAGLVDKVTGGAMGTSRAKELADALLDELENRRGLK